MKIFFTILYSLVINVAAFADNNIDSLKIKTVGKSSIEAVFTAKQVASAKITISNQTGKIVFAQNFKIIKGINKVALLDTKTIDEGTYVISLEYGGKKMKAKFVNFKGEI